MVRGAEYSLAWRVFDARYWGVPQRRKRIFLAVDFGGQSAGEILFEHESGTWNFAQGGETRQETAGDAGTSVKGTELHWGQEDRIGGWIEREDRIFAYQSEKRRSTVQEHIYHKEDGIADSLTQQKQHIIKKAAQLFENHGQDSRITGPLDVVTHIDKRRNVIAETVGAFSTGQSASARGIGFSEIVSPTLKGDAGGNTVPGVVFGLGGLGGGSETVRRLTPTECLRLQGFPDWWFDGIPGYSDTQAYKAIGNSLAVPCAEWIMGRIKTEEDLNNV